MFINYCGNVCILESFAESIFINFDGTSSCIECSELCCLSRYIDQVLTCLLWQHSKHRSRLTVTNNQISVLKHVPDILDLKLFCSCMPWTNFTLNGYNEWYRYAQLEYTCVVDRHGQLKLLLQSISTLLKLLSLASIPKSQIFT